MKNNNAQTFFTLLLGIMLGGGLGYLLLGTGSGQAEAAMGLSNGAAAMQPEARVQEPDVAALRSGGEDAVRAKPKKASVAQVSVAEAADLLEGVEVNAVTSEEGQGRIFGKVVDAEGQPLAGAVVRLTGRSNSISSRSPSSVGQGAPERDSLKEAVRKAAQTHHDHRARSLEAKTDGQGLYVFEGLVDQTWGASAYLEDFVVSADASASSVRIGTELNFTAEPVQEVPVEILTPDGVLAERAYLVVTTSGERGRSRNYDWTPSEAFVRLVPGRYKVRALSHGTKDLDLSELASTTEKLVVEVGTTLEPLTLKLAPRLGISGYISSANDIANPAGFQVRLLALAQEQELDLSVLGDSDKREWGYLGRLFAFTDLEPGRYAVGVSRDWGSPIVVHEIVELSDAPVEVLLEMPELDLSQMLRISVLDASGTPLDDVRFQFREELDGSSHSRGVQARRDKDETYLLTIPEQYREGYLEGKKKGATYQITATHEEYGTTEADLAPGQTDVVLAFVVPGRLTITIPGYSGSGYEGRVHFSVAKTEGDKNGRHYSNRGQEVVTPEGLRVFEGLEPGSYRVTMTVSPKTKGQTHWSDSSTVNSLEIDIREGENSARLAIPNLYPLRVHWADGKEGKSLHLSLVGSENRFGGYSGGTFDENLIASWEELPAGNYQLQYYSGMAKVMDITIPCGEIEFTPMVINAMSISITSLDGNLAKAGFRDGDVIIGADGKEFKTQADIMGMSRLMMDPGSTIAFMVQRGNKVVTINVEGSTMSDWEEMGGRMNPTSR